MFSSVWVVVFPTLRRASYRAAGLACAMVSGGGKKGTPGGEEVKGN